MTGRVVCRRLLVAPVCAVTLTACVTPAFDNGDYVSKAKNSVDGAVSEIETTRITLQAVQANRVFTTSADETISGNEAAMDSISNSFSSVQPPPSADALHDETAQLLSEAEDAVIDSRIAVRRDDDSEIAAALQLVIDVSTQLRQYSEQLK